MENGENLLKYFDIKNKNIVHNTIDGKKSAPIRIALPFQTIETVNESAADRKRNLELFAQHRDTEWRNRLIWGDKKYVLPSLLPELAGKVNLIYIDPPFNVGADFSFTANVPPSPFGRGNEGEGYEDETTTFIKQPSIIEQKAYRDTWGKGLDSYLQWFYETVILLRELLTENGSIYVHLDWHVAHYAKVVLDEVFSYNNFRNEIVWQRTGAHNDPQRFGNIHDVIFICTKSQNWIFNIIQVPHTDEHLRTRFNQIDEKNGLRFFAGPITAPGDGPQRKFRGKLLSPPSGRHWSYTQEKIDELEKEDRIYYSSTGTPYLKQYMEEYVERGRRMQSIWTDILPSKTGNELVDYPTQKLEALLERIIKASSNEGDLVLDIFVGSGTTAAVAEKNNRRWIACDLGRFAIHTTRKRLLGIPNVKPFVVQNLGKYERQEWVSSEFYPQPHATSPVGRRGDVVDAAEETKIWIPPFNSKEMIRRARALRKRSTPAEEILWDVLRDRQFNNLKFRRQHIIEKFITDFYCAEYKLAIEIDGSIHDEKEQIERDQFRQKIIEDLEIKVIRFKNDEIFNELTSVLQKIYDAILPLPAEEGLRVRAEKEKAYRNFIIELCHGQPLSSFVWLHGIKAGRMIHVGSVDAPVSLGDVKSIIQEFWKSVGKDSHEDHSESDSSGEESQTKVSDSSVVTLPQNDILKNRVNGIDILGWEFAFDLNETAVQHAAANKVDLKFKKIPREVLEKKAVEQGDIHFFELAALSVKTKVKGKELELTLKDFIIPPDDVPQEVQSAITHWSQWIDYWAVDWNYRDDTFHNEWQSYRTKKEPKIDLSVKHTYEEKGNYTVLVKVIDILGNDTTKVLSVEIK
ncbi:MAG: DUF559 domain-containing protein [Bacteroidetes bacterium]|nr:DUF559 domain-containing protein [Bacteroidota bacterium]MBU2637154.1 DUF559 domain-containing protein [Bacteroidota bacterium]